MHSVTVVTSDEGAYGAVRAKFALGSPRPGTVTGELTDDRQAHAWLTSNINILPGPPS